MAKYGNESSGGTCEKRDKDPWRFCWMRKKRLRRMSHGVLGGETGGERWPEGCDHGWSGSGMVKKRILRIFCDNYSKFQWIPVDSSKCFVIPYPWGIWMNKKLLCGMNCGGRSIKIMQLFWKWYKMRRNGTRRDSGFCDILSLPKLDEGLAEWSAGFFHGLADAWKGWFYGIRKWWMEEIGRHDWNGRRGRWVTW